MERLWRDYALDAPREVTTFVVTMTFPAAPGMPEVIHGRPVAIVGGVHCGGDTDAAMAELQPLRELGAPLFDMSQPTLSHHLKKLREAGIVESERRGLWAYYYVLPDALKELSAWLS